MLLSKYFILVLFCLIGSSLSAEIEIVSYSVSPEGNANSCDGTISLNAYGNAGPFTVVFPAVGSREEIVFTDGNGFLEVPDLCRGVHTIQVYPTRFPTCTKILSVKLFGATSKTDNVAPLHQEVVAGTDMHINVSPNPSDGRVTLDVSGGKLLSTPVSRAWSVAILGASGKVFHEQSVPQKASGSTTEQTFQLNLEHLTAGIYFVRVIRPDGLEGRARVILR